MMFEPRLLRAFVVLADTGSFTLAATNLHLTQSTISQQINRLETAVGKTLFDRTQRPIQLTNSGEKLLGYARKILSLQCEAQALVANSAGSALIKIGIPDDIASEQMIGMFADFVKQHQEIRLDVTTGLSLELTHRYRNGDFDILVVKETHAADDHRLAICEPMAWYQSLDAPPHWSEPLPLITFPSGGLYRDTMFERITQEGKLWYIAFSSGSLNNLLSAVEAGLGYSLLPVRTTAGRRVTTCPHLGNEQPMTLSLYRNDGNAIISKLADNIAHILVNREALFEQAKGTSSL
ncbi:LysR family transcriptional regulator [Shewanella baltica]|uniref:LysR family transcriptional regulator n=1 Tax=Shewanella baltica TaxID=62322 RepID=UPI00217EDC96|nr:LysR family transcriptional regulator [Shewanella baltica]